MNVNELDTVAMEVDLPSHGLKRGDIGAVVQVCSPDTIEVEFVTAAGHTQALVRLSTTQIRAVGARDLLAVRQLDAA